MASSGIQSRLGREGVLRVDMLVSPLIGEGRLVGHPPPSKGGEPANEEYDQHGIQLRTKLLERQHRDLREETDKRIYDNDRFR